MFILAFESADCKDYISDELYQALRYPWVPVVRGGADYSKLLPAEMVVDATHMSAKMLARKLQEIAASPELYANYLRWQQNMEQTIVDYQKVDTCKICEKVKSTKIWRMSLARHWSYYSLYKWWYEDSGCVYYNPKVLD
jgi:hypothetical protein